jgi:hypothetical protein
MFGIIHTVTCLIHNLPFKTLTADKHNSKFNCIIQMKIFIGKCHLIKFSVKTIYVKKQKIITTKNGKITKRRQKFQLGFDYQSLFDYLSMHANT